MIFSVASYFVVAAIAPWLVRRLGRNAFLVLAALAVATTGWALTRATSVFDGRPVVESREWIPQQGVSLAFRCDALALLMVFLAAGVGVLVLVYCARYFAADEPGLGAFAGVLVAFAGAMIGLVTTDDLILLYVFWELTTVFSYLLIGHRSEHRGSRRAAMQALTMTTFGGLAMLVGLILLGQTAGTYLLSEILAAPPGGTLVTTAIVLILVGALAKAAIVPFGSWLPAAMAAPTPVSAYLHAAAMVKAGVYLVARLAPGFAELDPWRPIVLIAGCATLLLAGWRALREDDLKRVLAYGTVSQLGLLTAVTGAGNRDAALAGIAMLIAHALFKATLFLVVGVVDHAAGTRDLRRLSGLARTMPITCLAAVVAALSMAGLPPTVGFVAKEAVYEAFLHRGRTDTVVLGVLVAGSALTAAYSLRFVWGAFARKPGVPTTRCEPAGALLLGPALLLGAGCLALGLAAGALDHWISSYADLFPSTGSDYHLALWHGPGIALNLSAAAICVGVVLFLAREPVLRLQSATARIEPSRLYDALVRGVDRSALQLTGTTQRGSMPVYVGVILLSLIAIIAATALGNLPLPFPRSPRWSDSAAQLVVCLLVIGTTLIAAGTRGRLPAVLLVGVTGYGCATLFVLQGAPDLALTQGLVETVSVVVFLLVLRRLPRRFGDTTRPGRRVVHIVLGALTGAVLAGVAVSAFAARTRPPVSRAFAAAAEEAGGKEIVSVLLVDIRAWDTMGEIAVLAVAAIGVTSLIFVRRDRALPRLGDRAPDQPARGPRPVAAETLVPERRTVVFEMVARVVFPTVLVLSLYFLFSGHSTPGGGFAGGITAGLALLVRYLAGGRYELAEAAPLPAGRLLGAGLVIGAGTGLVGLIAGGSALRSTVIDGTLPPFGDVHIATSVFFDIGVYLLVVGLVQDVLSALGAELDRRIEQTRDQDAERTVIV
ncbi:Na+/H+ antiporter subunit A [Embleya scabrispora]|uniref:Na+/H+ antiporter subunit A n=1 Tax=Embleya scabrispora TaxID=159449 RepID=UPI00037B6F94|nr:Na+/H+ antiporter subunit A [Embleya scabrispora]MYS83575.1 Na+/H+ antiporter subunit A [Streptomyces sp. SID5474]